MESELLAVEPESMCGCLLAWLGQRGACLSIPPLFSVSLLAALKHPRLALLSYVPFLFPASPPWVKARMVVFMVNRDRNLSKKREVGKLSQRSWERALRSCTMTLWTFRQTCTAQPWPYICPSRFLPPHAYHSYKSRCISPYLLTIFLFFIVLLHHGLHIALPSYIYHFFSKCLLIETITKCSG